MGIIKSKGFRMVCVAAVLTVVGAFLYGVVFDEPKAEATGVVKPVFPERGEVASITQSPKGGVMDVDCADKSTSTRLADSGGTVSVNGLLVTNDWTDDTVTISFKDVVGPLPFVSGFVIGDERIEPFTMPKMDPNEVLNGITLDTRDFSESGQFQDIVLCGEGK